MHKNAHFSTLSLKSDINNVGYSGGDPNFLYMIKVQQRHRQTDRQADGRAIA